MAKRKKNKSAARAAPRKKRAARRAPSSAALNVRMTETALAAFAHDIRTPLTGILALGELLATSELGERERNWVATLKSNAEHLAALTTLVVDTAKARMRGIVLRRSPFSPRRLAEIMAASLAARAHAKGLEGHMTIAGDLPAHAIGDVVRLRAALENLIDNAVKFTERGDVTLTVTAKRAPRNRCILAFSVEDSGIGLTRMEIKRLFRPFAQASAEIARRYGGAGLGLSLVKQLAVAMGGDLAVESRPGRGSTFRLTIPVETVVMTDDMPDGSAHGAGTVSIGRSLHILCAEDNPYGRVVMNAILTELGHKTDFAGSGEAAIEAVKRGSYNVVLMDVMLPGIDGIEASRRIRALPAPAGRIPIIGISGRTSDETAARGAGMSDYLVKPVGPKALAEALVRVTASRSPNAPV
jgi:CheY-like chemotaxis protein